MTNSKNENLLDGLNKEQAEAVLHKEGPLLIVAGAGTGKTTVITRRITHLIQQEFAKPSEILALTFTDKAAGEMEERVDMLMPLGYTDSWISTFHSFCQRILESHALDIGLPNDFTLLDGVGQWVFVYKNLDKFKLNYYRPLGNPSKFIDAMLTHFSRCKDELISPVDYLNYAESLKLNSDSSGPVSVGAAFRRPRQVKNLKIKDGQLKLAPTITATTPLEEAEEIDETEIARIEELAGAYHTYQKLLVDNNYLDFADLINYTLELFQKRPNILKFYQNKFKYILVDEFQDTNFAQYQLVKMLAGDRKNLTVVGDDDQSIYKFRGASVSNILKFKEDFPALKQITLVENYRSSQNILDLAYNFIQTNNPDRLEVKLEIDKKLKSNTAEEGTIEVLEADDLSAELACVANKILEIHKNTGCSWNDFAILIRANSAANDILPVLAAHGIPYTFFANKGLYRKPIIVDILAYLKILEDCHDSNSLYRVLCLPKFKMPHDELATILRHAHKATLSLYEALGAAAGISGISPESRALAGKLVELIRHHSAQAKITHATEIFIRVIHDLGIDKKISDDTLEHAENRELLDQFYKKIEFFEQQEADKSLHNFLANLNLELEAGSDGIIKFDPNLGPESLKILTIHSAKGLEFEHVFVINMVDQRFPTRQKSDTIEIPKALIKDILPEGDFHLQEERRLFYVAITRAKKHLYFSWAKDYGGNKTKKPSLFLQETKLVPSDFVSKATGKVVFTKPAEKLPQVFKVLPKFFSFSQLNDFESCPLKYKYVHYLKLPTLGNHYFSFGNSIHKVFEQYLMLYKKELEQDQQDLFGQKNKGEIPDFKVLTELYKKHWVDEWYKSKAEKELYWNLGLDMIKKFYEHTKNNPCHPKYIEQRFKLFIGPYIINGKIDRADSTPGGIEILDYKTGAAPKKNDKKDIDQLRIYQLAAEESLHEQVLGMKYWYLKSDQFLQEDIASKEELGELKNRLLELMERIVYVTQHDLFRHEHEKSPRHDCEYEDLE